MQQQAVWRCHFLRVDGIVYITKPSGFSPVKELPSHKQLAKKHGFRMKGIRDLGESDPTFVDAGYLSVDPRIRGAVIFGNAPKIVYNADSREVTRNLLSKLLTGYQFSGH